MALKLLDSLNTIWKLTRFIARNTGAFRATKQLYNVRINLSLANMELGKLDYQNPIYVQRLKEFNQVMIELVQGKWLSACAMETHSQPEAKALWQKAFAIIRLSQAHSQQLLEAVQSGVTTPLGLTETPLSNNGTETLFADGAPLVPEINPVVILQGSDFEMGYQYAQQLVEIYGPWIFQRKTGKDFSAEELACLRKWEEQLRLYAPEILKMCEGWAAGAQALGIPMRYEDVVDIWTGHKPPAQTYLGLDAGEPFMSPPYCSGAAAWGRATVDGQLVTSPLATTTATIWRPLLLSRKRAVPL